jgi:hypothetical protein
MARFAVTVEELLNTTGADRLAENLHRAAALVVPCIEGPADGLGADRRAVGGARCCPRSSSSMILIRSKWTRLRRKSSRSLPGSPGLFFGTRREMPGGQATSKAKDG